MNKDVLGDWEVIEESYAVATRRYTGFGSMLFSILQDKMPQVFDNLKFYQPVKYQSENVLATYEDALCAFGIQLDPLCEVIVLWNDETRIEIGTWSNGEYEE
ncbi:MAG: hypothetical protein ICV83_30595, partial [Cytophagales bacterium]|nr:hypothetical protein [Cytophagales bacterium]